LDIPKKHSKQENKMVAKTLQPTTGTVAPVLRISGYLSRIPDPDFYPSRIPAQTTAPQEGGKIFVLPLFCSHKYAKIVNNFIFEQVKKFF
jgi:hypothetical protein